MRRQRRFAQGRDEGVARRRQSDAAADAGEGLQRLQHIFGARFVGAADGSIKKAVSNSRKKWIPLFSIANESN